MKLGTLLYLPRNYPCAKFGCYSLIYDVTMTAIPKVLHMFVNQVLFRYKNVASVFIRLFGILECCSLHFNGKMAKSFMKRSDSWLQKPLKLSKFWVFPKMLTSVKYFAEFQCFDKKITKSMFLPPKKPIKTKYKCQKTEKVELDSSM